jgi:hypothetical protein
MLMKGCKGQMMIMVWNSACLLDEGFSERINIFMIIGASLSCCYENIVTESSSFPLGSECD